MKTTSLFCAILLLALAVEAGENGAAKKDNPLAKLPSKSNAAHIAKIKALGDDSWVNLGQAGECNRFPRKSIARGRAWGAKMAYAPDLGGAFFCGTGSHGAQPEGYYMDDLWFYDAAAHKWICLYPGATKQTKCKLDKNGFEVDMKGNHVPISYLSHAYNNITYDTDRKKYFIFWTQCPWWGRAVPQRWGWLDQKYPAVKKRSYGNPGNIIMNGKHPLFWDVKTGKWERRFVSGKGPGGRYEGQMEYIPSRKQTFRLHHGTTYFYDYDKNQWINSGAKKVPMGYDANGCYDQKGEKIYVGGSTYFWVYDLKANAWKKIDSAGRPGNLGQTVSAQMYYDSVNDAVVWHKSGGPIFVYDTKNDKWSDLGNTYTGARLSGCWSGFYHPKLNAHLFYVAGDSRNQGASWAAYRYRRADSKAAVAAAASQKGEAVKGIQLSIRARVPQFKKGAPWRFDARVYNTGKEVVALDFYDGMTYLEIDGPQGPIWPPDRKAGVKRAVRGRKGSRSFLVAIPGGRSTWIGSGRMGMAPGKPITGTKLTSPALAPGKYKVRWVYRNEGPDDTDVPRQYRVSWNRKKVPEWIGKVVSNELEITVTE